MYRVELFRGNCIGGKSPGIIVLEEISWGGNCPKSSCPGEIVIEPQFKYLFFEVIY